MPALTGAKSSIGTSAVQVISTSTVLDYGISIKASASNTGKVYVGIASGVTASSADATDGYELSLGEEIFIPKAMVANANMVYVIGSAAGQKVFYICV